MCDYSLEMYGSRPAREGEIYVTTRFRAVRSVSPQPATRAPQFACSVTPK
jgi:hypothetical protein